MKRKKIVRWNQAFMRVSRSFRSFAENGCGHFPRSWYFLNRQTTQTNKKQTMNITIQLSIGDKVTIPQDCVAPCLHDNLSNAEVVGFRHSTIDGDMVILKTARPWSAAAEWPENETIGIAIKHFNQ